MCKFRWTRPTSTLGVWSVKSATNSRLRATSPTKTSPSVKRTTRFVLSTRGWWSQSNCCKTWVEGMGGRIFGGKWEKLEAACFFCWPAQLLSCLNWAWQRRWWGGAHICRTSEFMQMGIFGVAQEWSLLVQRLFQVSYWPCTCHSKSASEPNLFSLSEECHPP